MGLLCVLLSNSVASAAAVACFHQTFIFVSVFGSWLFYMLNLTPLENFWYEKRFETCIVCTPNTHSRTVWHGHGIACHGTERQSMAKKHPLTTTEHWKPLTQIQFSWNVNLPMAYKWIFELLQSHWNVLTQKLKIFNFSLFEITALEQFYHQLKCLTIY